MQCQLPDMLLSCAIRSESRVVYVYMQDQGQLFGFVVCCLAWQLDLF
jgi:hypothetical protein